MSSSEGFGGNANDHLHGQGAIGFTPDVMNVHGYQQVPENGLSKKKRNKNRQSSSSGGSNTAGLQMPSGSKTVDKSSGFLPKNGRKANGQQHNNQQARRYSHSEFELPCEKEDLDNNRGNLEFNGNFNGVHSPRGGATAAWNGKQDNTKAVLDPSSIVERLMHLRDCIKQVTSIMHSLEKTDEPVTGKQMDNLNQMLQMLRSEEQENMELLQQLLACREETERSNVPNSNQRELSPLQITTSTSRRRDNAAPQHSNENEEEPQNDLLLRMLDSQKKFSTIQEQQASLLRLQKQAEEKLAAARAFHDHIVQTSLAAAGVAGSISSNLSSSSASSCSSGAAGGHPNPLLLQDQEACHEDSSMASLVLHSNADDLEDDLLVSNRPPVVPPRKDESRRTPSFNLEDIQKRISALREMQFERQSQCDQAEDALAATSPRSLSSEVLSREQAHRATEQQRQHLENKLRQLQEKKQQMNTLLAELSMLHACSQSNSDDQLDQQSALSPASFPSPVNSASHKVTSDLDEAQRKLKQLEEMKSTLRTLQRLTENIEQVDNSLNKEETLPPPPPARGRSQSHSESVKSLPSLKPDNLHRDCPTALAQFPARRHYEAEGRANEDADTVLNVAAGTPNAAAALLSMAATSSGSSRSLGAAAADITDPRIIDHKVKKLADTKTKLQQLKLLLRAMQQEDCDGDKVPDALSALFSNLQPVDLASPANANSAASPVANHEDLGEESEDSGVSADQRGSLHDLEVVLQTAKSERQLKHDLELLLRERRQLESMHDLSSLQLHLGSLSGSRSALGSGATGSSAGSTGGDSLNNCRDRSSGEGGSLLRARAGGQLASSFTSNEMGRQDNLLRDKTSHRSEAKTLNSQANNSKSRVRSRSSVSPTTSVPVNHNNNTIQQNGGFSELSDQLNYNLALRDELRAQKAVLQELLNQERSKQMGFSQNQDTQSQGDSPGKTEKSEVVPIQCSGAVAPPLDNHEATAVAHWGMMTNTVDETPSYSASENLTVFDEHNQSGLSSPWQKNFPSSSPAQEDLFPFKHSTHLNFPQRKALRFPPPLPPPHSLPSQPPEPQQQQPQLWNQQHQSQWDQLSRHFQKQAESTHALCQSVLREQQAMIMMAANSASGTSSTGSSNGINSSGGAPIELLSSYVQQLQQQQQLLFSLSHCFHLLCLQQLQVTQIHAAWAMQQGSGNTSQQEMSASPFSYQTLSEPLTSVSCGYGSPWLGSGPKNPPANPQPPSFFPHVQPQVPFGYQPMPGSAYNIISGDDNTSVSSGNSLAGRGAPETLNNQMPPRSRTNNFLDNFHSNSHQNLLSSKCNDPQQKAKPTTPNSHMPFSFSTGEENLSRSPSQSSINRQNISSDGGYHFGGVRPRTKKPNLNQDKSNSLTHGPPNVSSSTSGSQQQQQQQQQQQRGHLALTSRSSLYSPCTSTIFGKSPAENPHFKDPPTPQVVKAFADPSLQESIYSEVVHLLGEWGEQPSVLRDLLDQIRAFQGPQQQHQQPQPHSQRTNLADFTNTVADKSDDGSSSTCKLSKQSASFGSKCLNNNNNSIMQQERPLLVNVPSSHRHSVPFYQNDQHRNQDVGHINQAPQRQGNNSMESIPESYNKTAVKSVKPDIVSNLRVLPSEVPGATRSEESCSMASSDSSPPSSSSSNHLHNNNNNNNHKGNTINSPSQQQSEDYRAAPDGGAALPPSPPLPPPLLHQPPPSSNAAAGTRYPEDCGSYNYDAEGETEAETEDDDTKDLAEADQSAGQINLVHGLRDMVIDGSVRSCSSSQSLAVGGACGGVGEGAEGGDDGATMSTDIISTSSGGCCSCPLVGPSNGAHDSASCDHSCLSSSAHASAPDLDVDELALDDVPIKLETLSPDELRRQIAEEQSCNSLLGEILNDSYGSGMQLAPDNESGLSHPGTF